MVCEHSKQLGVCVCDHPFDWKLSGIWRWQSDSSELIGHCVASAWNTILFPVTWTLISQTPISPWAISECHLKCIKYKLIQYTHSNSILWQHMREMACVWSKMNVMALQMCSHYTLESRSSFVAILCNSYTQMFNVVSENVFCVW